MNKKELTNAVVAKTGLNKTESRKTLDAVIETITEEMKRNGRVIIIGFGSFSVKQKSARKGMNPAHLYRLIFQPKK